MSILFGFCNAGFKTTTRIFADQKVEGHDHVPETGPAIFVSNHLSNLDPAIVASITKRSPNFLAKKELFKFPLFAWLLKWYGAHPLNRGTSDLKALRWAMTRLKEDNPGLILFPEGTRNRDGSGMKRALPGVTHIALQSGVQIIPVGLTGTEPLQNVLKVFAPRANIRINIGKPFRINNAGTGRPGREALETMTNEIMVRIAHLLPDEYRGYYREMANTPFEYTEELA